MTQFELMADVLVRNLEMLKMTLADFTDADLMVRPCVGANHTAWQLGHLINSETRMVGMCGGSMPELPPGFAEKFTKETTKNDDPHFFPGKAALLEQFAKTRAGTINFAKNLTPAGLDKPGPAPMATMAPTVGHLLGLANGHVMMHMGQIQVIRRKLGKPILF